jgi:hypothetical protein
VIAGFFRVNAANTTAVNRGAFPVLHSTQFLTQRCKERRESQSGDADIVLWRSLNTRMAHGSTGTGKKLDATADKHE